MSSAPSPLQTLRAIASGYLPRLVQGRGWSLAAITVLPIALITATVLIARRYEDVPVSAGLTVFHQAFVPFLLPILSMLAAPAGLREDMEQRTIPLMLVRPAFIPVLPFGKGILWFAWGALWLLVATLFLLAFGTSLETVLQLQLALLAAYWAQLGFMSLLTLLFKRGVLWGALFCFGWDPLVRIFPNNLQRLTFLHYIESIAGSRGGGVNSLQLLAQDQITTPVWLAVLILLLVGAACWAACGYKLWTTPIGLAGREAEG
jgi:hypothetical protein